MVQFFRNERSKEECPIILLKGENFSLEDSAKASFLGVSGTVDEALGNQDMDRLQSIMDRFLPLEEKRRSRRYRIDPWQRFELIFTHPESNVLVTGQIRDISIGGLSFAPENKSLIGNIGIDSMLENCSLRAGDHILSPVCRLVRIGRIVSMEFISFPEGEKDELNDSLKKLLSGELVNFEGK